MDSSIILSNIQEIVSLNETEKAFLESVLIPRPFKQGEVIVKSGDTARYLMFVHSGYTVTYYTDEEGADYVIQFAARGWWSGDMHCMSRNETTSYSTKALCDGELLLLPGTAMEQLFEKYPVFERYFRIVFHHCFLKQQGRLIENYSATAAERYQSFLTRYPGMEQYVPQKYIASYLGMTPEFLSKIRNKPLAK